MSRRRLIRDASLCAVIFVGTLAYLSRWPRDFYVFDEGLYLYEAKRVLDGDVIYRDFFEILTPLWFYLVAGLYALLGVSIETARLGMAVVHGLIGVLIFTVCRSAGVRPSIALLATLTHLTLAYPACPMATPHWMSTLLILVMVLAAVRSPATTARRAFWWGALTGLLILVQQQKGLVMALAPALTLAFDWTTSAGRRSWPSLLRQGGAYAVGVLLVVGPVIGIFVAVAGPDEVFRALVEFPLVNYRHIHADIPWGGYVAGLVPLGFLIENMPLLLPLSLLVVLWRWYAGAPRTAQRPLVVTLIFSSAALASVVYHPNHLHFAYTAPLWVTLAAQIVEMALRALDGVRPLRIATGGLVLALMIGCAWQLQQNLLSRRRIFGVPVETAFGRIDLPDEDSVADLRRLIDLLRDQQVSEIFAYPTDAGIYLLTGMRNPTRYQIVLARYTSDDQIAEIIATLEARRVPVVITNPYWGFGLLQQLNSYVARQYQTVPELSGRVHVRRAPQPGFF